MPISIASSSDMVCLRAALQSTRNTWWMVTMPSDRETIPGVEQRNSILIGASKAPNGSQPSTAVGTKRNATTCDRAIFTDVTELSGTEIGVLKVGSDTATVILRRLGHRRNLRLCCRCTVAVYYHDTVYWTKLPYQPSRTATTKGRPSQWFPLACQGHPLISSSCWQLPLLLALDVADCRHMTSVSQTVAAALRGGSC